MRINLSVMQQSFRGDKTRNANVISDTTYKMET